MLQQVPALKPASKARNSPARQVSVHAIAEPPTMAPGVENGKMNIANDVSELIGKPSPPSGLRDFSQKHLYLKFFCKQQPRLHIFNSNQRLMAA